LLAQTGITGVGVPAPANLVTVNGGNWYSPTGITANLVAGPTNPKGINATNQAAAFTELTSLVGVLNGLTVTNASFAGGGTQTISPGVYKNATIIEFTSGATITLDAQGVPDAQFIFIADTEITFTSVTSVILVNGAKASNVFWLAGSKISTAGATLTDLPGVLIAGTEITFAGAININNAYARTALISFIGISTVRNVIAVVICYAKGTNILTKRGYVPIETITEDDSLAIIGTFNEKVAELNSGISYRPVKWCSSFTVNNLNNLTMPICIKKHALGKNQPFEDLYVSPAHGILIGKKLIFAQHLINEKTIFQYYPLDEVTYYHVELQDHSAILANGIISETFLEEFNRYIFDDGVRPEIRYNYNILNHSTETIRLIK
jgi:hypothetical protein